MDKGHGSEGEQVSILAQLQGAPRFQPGQAPYPEMLPRPWQPNAPLPTFMQQSLIAANETAKYGGLGNGTPDYLAFESNPATDPVFPQQPAFFETTKI